MSSSEDSVVFHVPGEHGYERICLHPSAQSDVPQTFNKTAIFGGGSWLRQSRYNPCGNGHIEEDINPNGHIPGQIQRVPIAPRNFEKDVRPNGHLHKPRSNNRRNNMARCTQFLRYATTIFTFILFIAGAGLLGLGIYLLGSDYGAKEMSSVLGNVLYQVVTYVLICCGAALVLISMCGCCGALRESKCMLMIFIASVSIIVLALITSVIIVFVFRAKLEDNIVRSMEDVVVKRYGVDLLEHTDNRIVTDTMNWLQKELECCGVTGGLNTSTSWGIYKHSAWYKGFDTGKPYVPQSCCRPNGDVNICTGITLINGPPSQGPPVFNNMENNEHLYTAGCYDEIMRYVQNHLLVIGIASIGTVIIMLCGLFFSIYLYRRIDMERYH